MNPLFVIALGGASGAILRFLISSGVYNCLGRGFPYGTLAVNVIGSLLMGLLTAALVVEKVALSSEYRAAILVGFLGALTTFSTFSLDSYYLLEQQQWTKAALNIFGSVSACVFAVWIGLLIGKGLFSHSNGILQGQGWFFPYALVSVNVLVALLIGTISSLLLYKAALGMEQQVALIFIIVGLFITLSSLYLCLHLFASGYSFSANLHILVSILVINLILCSVFLALGWFLARQI